jgi:hypothetical protein
MLKKVIPFVVGIAMLAAVGCSGGDDGGPDPSIQKNDPSSSRQPSSLTGEGGGSAAAMTPVTD